MFILVFIITILILVVIHELGHFFAAKKFNIKVLEFGFGLPPRAWGKKLVKQSGVLTGFLLEVLSGFWVKMRWIKKF